MPFELHTVRTLFREDRCDFFALRLLYTFVTRSEDDHPRSVWQPAAK